MGRFKRILSIFLNKLYLSETVILFIGCERTSQSSSAKIVEVNSLNIQDALFFQKTKYLANFKFFLDRGDKGYYAYLNENCIHRSWVIDCPYRTIEIHPFYKRTLAPDEVYIHYCETASIARGNNIFPHVLSRIMSDFINKKVIIAANSKNSSSIKSITRAGFLPYQEVKILILCGFKFIKLRNVGKDKDEHKRTI